jgi:hypothetical protein
MLMRQESNINQSPIEPSVRVAALRRILNAQGIQSPPQAGSGELDIALGKVELSRNPTPEQYANLPERVRGTGFDDLTDRIGICRSANALAFGAITAGHAEQDVMAEQERLVFDQSHTLHRLSNLGRAFLSHENQATSEAEHARREREVDLGIHVAAILFGDDPTQLNTALEQALSRVEPI